MGGSKGCGSIKNICDESKMDTNDIDLGELLRENLLAVILISLGCLIIICICTSIIGILIYWWCMKRRRRYESITPVV